MRPASEGHSRPGDWRLLSVNPQATLHGQVGVQVSGPAANTGGQWRGCDQTRPVAELWAGDLGLGQLDTVSRRVRQPPAASDATGRANQGSLTDAGGSKIAGRQRVTESGGRMDTHKTRAGSVSGNTRVRSVSRRDVTDSTNSSCPPARGVTDSNNSCVSVPPAMPPVCPDITTSSEELVLGPDHIDMLLALAASSKFMS